MIQKIKHNTFLFAILINLLFLFISIFIFHPHFEVVDDQYMAFLAEGVYGSRSSMLVFTNLLYGKILSFFYSIYAGIRWYSILQISLLFIAFTSITYTLIKTGGNQLGTLLSFFLLLCFSYEGYVFIQYTKSAGYICAAGYLLMFHTLSPISKSNKRQLIIGTVLGGILVILGNLLRKESFYAVSLFMLCLGLYELIQIIRNTNRASLLKSVFQYSYPFLIVILLSLGANLYYTETVINKSDWNTYWQFNQKSIKLRDYNKLNWEGYEDAYSAIGVSENDVYLYKSWSFGDSDNYNLELMDQMLQIQGNRAINLDLIKSFITENYNIFFSPNSITYSFILFLCIYILVCIRQKHLPFSSLYAVIVLISSYSYFFYVERLPHRTIVLLIFSTTLIIAYTICRETDVSASVNIIPLIIILVSFCLFNYLGVWISDTDSYHEQKREFQDNVTAFYQSVSADKEHLYITDNATDMSTYAYDVFKSYPEGYLDNLAYFGYWLSGSPVEKKILYKYGVSNPYTAGLEKDNVYFIDNYQINEKELYIQDHFDKNSKIEFVENRFGFNIYQIH